jgi:hypothetical protein
MTTEPTRSIDDDRDEELDRAYIDGQKSAWHGVIHTALLQLGVIDPLTRAAHLELEHAALRRVLRELWRDYVPEPWNDGLALDSALARFSDYFLEIDEEP